MAYHRPTSVAEVQSAILRLVRLAHGPSDVIHAALQQVAHRDSGPEAPQPVIPAGAIDSVAVPLEETRS